MVDDFVTLGFLVLLQAVLGFDNLLYISLESKRAPEADQAKVRKIGIAIAIVLRIGLLFLLLSLIEVVQSSLFSLHIDGIFEGSYNIHSLIVLLGGVFIVYTAVKEVWHMMNLEEDTAAADKEPKSVGAVITMIVLMNLVFSFDSILSAIALTHVKWVMATAIVIGGLLMIWLADRVAAFLARNRMFEVLGLFVLLIVGIMLLSEGGHLAHMKLFGNEITPMTKTTFYFVIAVLVIVDLVQTRYHRKLVTEKNREAAEEAAEDAARATAG